MRWPWVSRLAFEVVRDERDRLAAQNAELTEALTRMKRWQAGMAEQVQPSREPDEPPPPELYELVRGFESEAMRRNVIDDAHRAHKRGTPWDHVIDALEATLLVDDDDPEWETGDAEAEPPPT